MASDVHSDGIVGSIGSMTMRSGSVLLTTKGTNLEELGFFLICSGYLVNAGKVLLVHHNKFDKWVPPGGHLEPGETFAQAAGRECFEETGLRVRVLSAAPVIHAPDANAVPEPVPFYVDVEREGFAIPALAQFFYLRMEEGQTAAQAKAQDSELHGLRWFQAEELLALKTFPQVRSLAAYALSNHPDAGPPTLG